jgi:hypothetical protein
MGTELQQRTAQTGAQKWYRYISKEWFCEAIQKLPIRWQPKDNKIAANEASPN